MQDWQPKLWSNFNTGGMLELTKKEWRQYLWSLDQFLSSKKKMIFNEFLADCNGCICNKWLVKSLNRYIDTLLVTMTKLWICKEWIGSNLISKVNLREEDYLSFARSILVIFLVDVGHLTTSLVLRTRYLACEFCKIHLWWPNIYC